MTDGRLMTYWVSPSSDFTSPFLLSPPSPLTDSLFHHPLWGGHRGGQPGSGRSRVYGGGGRWEGDGCPQPPREGEHNRNGELMESLMVSHCITLSFWLQGKIVIPSATSVTVS